ncbi:MAG: VOC family protein [Trebonia sp.]
MAQTARQPVAFDHVGLNVPDLEVAASWYCEALDLTPAPPFKIPYADLTGIMLLHEPSGYRIELLHRPGHRPGMLPSSAEDAVLTLGYGHICLRVKDPAQEYARLLEAGCSSRMEPMNGPRPGSVVCYLADPWGNLIEVINRD